MQPDDFDSPTARQEVCGTAMAIASESVSKSVSFEDHVALGANLCPGLRREHGAPRPFLTPVDAVLSMLICPTSQPFAHPLAAPLGATNSA